MSAPVSPADIRSARTITEEEWRALRLDAIASGPARLLADGDIPSVLISYQQGLLNAVSTHAVVVVEKSRRTGLTWAAGSLAVLTSAAQKAAGGMDTLYIGYNLDMAREFIDVCAMWARAFDAALGASGEEFIFADGPDRNIAAFRISFASGYEIVALASRPRSLRGRQGLVILDEAAFHDDLQAVLNAALAFLIWGGKVVVISTHFGEENPFNKLVKSIRGGEKPYHLMRIDFDQALNDGLYERICLTTGRAWSVEAEAAWRTEIVAFYGEGADEELFCVPSEGGGAFLPRPLIEARAQDGIPVLRYAQPASFAYWSEAQRNATTDAWLAEHVAPLLRALDPHLSHYLGGDYGRVSDLTVLWPLARSRLNVMVTPFVIELRRIPFDQQARIQTFVMKGLPRFVASNHDATGLGYALAEAAAQAFGQATAEETKLTVEWYRENMEPMRVAFETQAVVIPNDADIHSDLALLQLRHGVAHVPALKSGVKKDRHGDAAVALALALYASRRKAAHYGYESAQSAAQEARDARAPRPDDDDLPPVGRTLH